MIMIWSYEQVLRLKCSVLFGCAIVLNFKQNGRHHATQQPLFDELPN
uniref:Uncharacterized protein n=1 Tax=Arundo donax TaxID=35708 RepID=A0A0A8YWS3_ARUDO